MKRDKTTEIDEEEDVARLLQIVGKREEIPADLQRNWEQHFRQQLQQSKSRQRRHRWTLAVYASAAAVLLAALGVWLQLAPLPNPQWQVQVVHVVGTGIRLADKTLRAGDELAVPLTLYTNAATGLALRVNGYDVRLDHNTQLRLQSDQLWLDAGRLYVSDTASTATSASLPINTPFGQVRDVGTQFQLQLDDQHLVATVRRGAISLRGAGGEYLADAEIAGPRQLMVNSAAEVDIANTRGHGDDWQWINKSRPEFVLEGKSAFEFLRWVADESGMPLRFGSPAAEIYARTTLLHGDFGRLAPLQALDPVLASTDLQVSGAIDSEIAIGLLPRR